MGLGYKVHGIDLVQTWFQKQNYPRFACQQGNIATTKMNKTYDVILSLFHVMSYQITNKQLKDVFAMHQNTLIKMDCLF